MTFSIVIPSYNGSKYIRQAIDSAINQSRKADEIIISDDNSSDDTLIICQTYGEQIKIYSNLNGPSGFVNGWNNAIAHAKGDYISVLHQDDILAPTFLEEAERALTQYPDVKHLFVSCNYINFNNKITHQPPFIDNITHLYTGNEYIELYIHFSNPRIHRCPGVITHKSIFEICKYREEAGHIADDDFFYRVGQYTTIIGIHKPLASYRNHSDSATGSLSDYKLNQKLFKDYLYQVKSWDENILKNQKHRKYINQHVILHGKRLINYALKAKNYREVIKVLKSITLKNLIYSL